MSDLITLVKEFLVLDSEKRDLKEREALNKHLLDDIKQKILAAVTEGRARGEKFKNISINGRVVYISCDRWPKAKEGNEQLIAALKRSDLGQYVHETFNTQSLRGYTNELVRNLEDSYADIPEEERPIWDANDAIPPELKPYLEITETFDVKSVKGR